MYIYIVTLPSRRASICPKNFDGARAKRPRQIRLREPYRDLRRDERLLLFRVLNCYIFYVIFILYFGQPIEEYREEDEEESFTTADTALPFHPPIRVRR